MAGTLSDNKSSAIWITNETKLFYEDYTIVSLINKGGYAVVYDCIKKKQNMGVSNAYVVKCINKTKILMLSCKKQALICDSLKKEIESLQTVYGHEHMVKLEQVYEDESNLFLVFEKCHGGELYDYISNYGKLNEKQAKIIMNQLLSTVRDLHENYHICHGDLNPSNILLVNSPVCHHSHGCPYWQQSQQNQSQQEKKEQENGAFSVQPDPLSCSYCQIEQIMDIDEYNLQIKIIDFGFSKKLKPFQCSYSLSGSIHYTAPEIIVLHKNDHLADCWSLGIILFVMLYGYLPFYVDSSTCSSLNEEMGQVFKLIACGFHPIVVDVKTNGHGPFFPNDYIISKEAMDLISKLLRNDFRIRFTANLALRHAWFYN